MEEGIPPMEEKLKLVSQVIQQMSPIKLCSFSVTGLTLALH